MCFNTPNKVSGVRREERRRKRKFFGSPARVMVYKEQGMFGTGARCSHCSRNKNNAMHDHDNAPPPVLLV
ncbi:MAG: hypothetical protein F6K23_21890 [Okeania sp. SIO2C9]|uniref:hypothetical protein n=1 Tax=Okeania sp. SIO2C9 TaxID=2607791 RepID=UPI0013BF9EB1|nr:hypothetical protein [Okeania sp. SIO2C9]NEQ75470.1 hypothetical protein [Okeania sp. SIO2C9]